VRSETSSGLAQRSSANDIVVIDNLRSRKVPGVRGEAMEPRGATLRYLPPYSAAGTPMSFSKLTLFAVERTVPRLYRRVGLFARSPTARETRNYFSRAAMRNITGICF
jgi:hypothetical protein